MAPAPSQATSAGERVGSAATEAFEKKAAESWKDRSIEEDGPYVGKGMKGKVPKDVEAGRSAFKHGELLERTIPTSKGDVGVLAEIEVDGNALHLRDLTVFGEGRRPLTGLTREMLKAKTALVEEARAAGFSTLRITAERVQTSSSANPGKLIDVTIDLIDEGNGND